MIRWTPQGVVAYPRAVQIRLNLNHPQRIPGKAPTPTRTMTVDEFDDNLHYFTNGLDGPRSRPCTSLILSGLTEDYVTLIVNRIEHFKSLGFTKLILHLDHQYVEPTQNIKSHADFQIKRVCSVKSIENLMALTKQTETDIDLSIMLNHNNLSHWEELIAQLRIWKGALVSFHYPYPSQTPPSNHTVEHIRASLKQCQKQCPHLRIHVKGLPLCYLAPLKFPFRQTGNRWYVDSDHQKDNALLFLPNVLQFHKVDACRFCPLDGQCDGFFLEHLNRGHYPPLCPPNPA